MRYLDSLPMPRLDRLATMAARKATEARKRRHVSKAARMERLERRLLRKWRDRARTPTPCPSSECRGGFVSGHDPHACGDC